MKALLLALTISLSTFIPANKAEAGVILGPTGVGVALVFGGLATAGGGFAPILIINSGLKRDTSRRTNGIAGALFAIGTAMFILDADKTPHTEGEFSTIPQYILDEVEEFAEMKKSSGKQLVNNYTEVVFTNDEVNELFEAVDENASLEELAILRSMLTSKIN